MTIHWWCVTIIKCQLVRALFSKSLSFQLRKPREGTPPPFTPRSLQDSNQGHLVATEELLESELRACIFLFQVVEHKTFIALFWVGGSAKNKQTNKGPNRIWTHNQTLHHQLSGLSSHHHTIEERCLEHISWHFKPTIHNLEDTREGC